MYEKKTNIMEFHHKQGRSKEYREEKSRLMKEIHKKRKLNTRAKKLDTRDPEEAERLRRTYSENAWRMKHQSCPFTMVDGVRREIQKMDRYNTHSGVITEEELMKINGEYK